jgi:hypothetical protein
MDQSICHPIGIAEDVPVKIRDFFIPMDVCYQTPLILGRPFLSTARGTIDVTAGIIKLNINGNVETIAFKPEMTKYCN